MYIVKRKLTNPPEVIESHFQHERDATALIASLAVAAIEQNKEFVFLQDTKAEGRAIKFLDGSLVWIVKESLH